MDIFPDEDDDAPRRLFHVPTLPEPTPKRRKRTSLVSKKDRKDIVLFINSLEMNLLLEEMESRLLKYSQQSKVVSTKVIEVLLCNEENKDLWHGVIGLHKSIFAYLYEKCGTGKDKYLIFQVEWHKYCSALLLPLDVGLEAVGLHEATLKTEIECVRRDWNQFSDSMTSNDSGVDVNKVMIVCTSVLYNFFLEQVKDQLKSPLQTSVIVHNTDEDDVYYRFGGAIISDMVKLRHKLIKGHKAKDKDKISQEIGILLAINTKDKQEMPAYLKYRDRGYMYTPKSWFIPFLRDLDSNVKQVTHRSSLNQHGDDLIKVAHTLIDKNDQLKISFVELLKINVPTYNEFSESATTDVYKDVVRKMVNIRVEEFVSSTRQIMASEEGKASTAGQNLRDSLLTNHTHLRTRAIRLAKK